MLFLYTTDLHGNCKKFNKIFEIAKDIKAKIIHIGADILPKKLSGAIDIDLQKKFIENFFKDWYTKCKKEKIKVLAHFGNDDVYVLKSTFRKYCSLLDEKDQNVGKYSFKAYGFVLDHPFGLKTACKLDYRGWGRPKYKADTIPMDFYPNFSHNGVLLPIDNINKYFENKFTIEEDLSFIKIKNKDRCIMSIHCPPYSLGLDACYGNNRSVKMIGSKSVYNWILNEQPLLVLSGHAHESFKLTNVWKAKINNSTIIQPGQSEKFHFVEVEINENKIKSKLYTLN